MTRRAQFGSSEKNPSSVTPSSLTGVYDHVVRTDQELVDALTDAESNPGVSIKLSKGTFTPYSIIAASRTFSLEEGTVIHGQSAGHDQSENAGSHPAPDRTIPDVGSALDLGGNGPLLDLTGGSGFELKSFGVENFTTAIEGGVEATDSSWEYGPMQSTFQDLAYYCGGYAMELRNFQRVRMDKVVCAECYGLHATAQTDGFQPGNSVITDFHVTPPDNANPAIHFEAKNASMNYVTLVRPQVIIGDGDGTNNAVFLEGTKANSAAVNGFDIIGGDFEGSYNRYVDGVFVTSSYIAFETNGLATDYDLYLDNDSRQNFIYSKDIAEVYSDYPFNQIAGMASNVDGRWFGVVYDADKADAVMYVGADTDTYSIVLGSTTSYNSINLEDMAKVTLQGRGLSTLSGTETGEIRRNVGDSRLYEWDGTSWQGVTISNTITP